jgi:hypothetical protein
LGLDFQSKHKNVIFNYGGPEPPLVVRGLSTLNMESPEPFAKLTADCHPIATKSRRYSQEDLFFIDDEVERLLKEGIIESSKSPWRAQVVVTKDENHKKRMAIDYSQTINKFTILDAFRLPRIYELVNQIPSIESSVQLIYALHTIKFPSKMMKNRTQHLKLVVVFRRLPFGVTKGVACFQREMVRFVQEEDLKATFQYLDNITISGERSRGP